MSMVQIHEPQMVPMELIDLSVDNPNEMTDDEFSALVEEILEHGWLVYCNVIGPYETGRYKMFSGEHRFKAAQVLEMPELPSIVVPAEQWEDDIRKVQLVKQNVLHGRLNPTKFTALFNDLASRYDAEYVQRLMGFTKQDAFDRLYEDARRALPPDMAKKLDAVRDELKSIDDLSLVLNRLFAEYGDTLTSNFMIFTWGGKESMMIQVESPQWKRLQDFGKWCVEEGRKMNDEIWARLDWPV